MGVLTTPMAVRMAMQKAGVWVTTMVAGVLTPPAMAVRMPMQKAGVRATTKAATMPHLKPCKWHTRRTAPMCNN